MSIHEDLDAARAKAHATLVRLRAKLDIDGDADVDADDIVAAIRKYEWLKLTLACAVGLVAGAVFF